MDIKQFFPMWDKFSSSEQQKLSASALLRTARKGTLIHGGSADCTGLLLVKSGQLRAYILSEEGREITIYRLFEGDICLFSASCIMRSIQFDISVSAEKDSEIIIIPPEVYTGIMETSAAAANYTNEIMATRFSEVVWLIEQIMWKSMDKRIASFLLSEAAIEETLKLRITHETIANHLGTHREVVTRILRYLQDEGTVQLSRGTVEITDEKALSDICEI